VMLTDVEGLYDRDPRERGARLLGDVPRITAEVERMAGGAGSEHATGGMVTKLKAARRLATQGVGAALLSGRRPGALAALLAGEPVGTHFPAGGERLSARDGWLSSAAKARGTILVDAGARRAVAEQGKSLLPSGVKGVLGQFGVGDPVELAVDAARPFARGLAGYAAEDVRRLAGKRSSQIEEVLGFRGTDEVVHRNDLVLLEALS
jgi:glutamate 5-kinase